MGTVNLWAIFPPRKSALIERFNVPRGVGQEAIETGLVGGPGEFVMDAEDCLAFGDDESGEVLSEVTALALVAEEVAVLSQGVLDQFGELNDPWHDQMLRNPIAPERIEGETSRLYLF